MTTSELLVRVAESDRSFTLGGANWVGKCLICNGPIAFDATTGEGATIEHIRARSRGGGEELENLAIVHGRCNWEKGRRWDPKRRRADSDYDAFIERLLTRRRERWREPAPRIVRQREPR
jgi:5-methylcytosine-specific restriction endonuclease McrA